MRMRVLAVLGVGAALAGVPAVASAQLPSTTDPRASLDATKPVFRGIRIFDISNIEAPVQVGQVQTCRGSHTHTLVQPKGVEKGPKNVYIYVSGTAGPRPATELAGCDGNNTNTPTGDNPSKWRIEVIKVPGAAPQKAAIVNTPRLFANE